MNKRTQAERLVIAETLVTEVLSEVYEGKVEDILQLAVNTQIEINRLVWKLNKVMEEEE